MNILGQINVETHLYPGIEKENLFVLDLARASDLVVIITGEESLENVDAAVTTRRDATLGIRTRDCAPICFGDGTRIGIAHVGWQGYSLGLVEKTLQYFNKDTLVVYVGPFLHSFEIKKDFCYDQLMQKSESAEWITEKEDGTLTFEFKKAVASLLPDDTVFDERDTGTDMSLPSHRRDKDSKGFLTTVSFA